MVLSASFPFARRSDQLSNREKKVPNTDAFSEDEKASKDEQRAAGTRVRRGTKRHRKPQKLKASAAIIRERADGMSKR